MTERLHLERDLVTLDTETTGPDVATDRVVQFAALRLSPDGSVGEFCTLVNPRIPIPIEARMVHGITDEMVAGASTFRQLAPEFLKLLQGADLCGYNLLRFDIPLLQAEFRRAGLVWDCSTFRIVDAQKIFYSREPRDLSAAVRVYCGREHAEAHGALADVRATLDVLRGQLDRYEDLPGDIGGLHDLCNRPDPQFVDSERRFRWRNREATFCFGKLAGMSLRQAVRDDPGYLRWMLGQEFGPEVRQIIANAFAAVFPVAPPLESEVQR